MRILQTIAWGLVCLSAVVAGGFLASNLAATRSESWGGAGHSVLQTATAPRTEFLAQPQGRLGALAANEPPALRLLPPPNQANVQANVQAGSEAGLVLANFNEDDQAMPALSASSFDHAGSDSAGSLASGVSFANADATRPVLAPPSLKTGKLSGLPGLNARAPALSAPYVTPAARPLSDLGGDLERLQASAFDAIPQAPDSMRGLKAEGRSLSLSLFGHTQANGEPKRDPIAGGDQDAKSRERNVDMQDPSRTVTSTPPKAQTTNLAAVDAPVAADATPRPSAALIDPDLQVASLNDDVGLLPNFQAPQSKGTSHSFPRLDISVALYQMNEPLPKSQGADRILVEKGARLLHLFEGDQLVKSYRIDLGFSPVGHKLVEGDGKTPEGDYRIDWRKKDSEFYRALHISYPNEQDASIAKFSGRDPGGAIMIHGRPNGFSDSDPLAADWTAGCIAVLNAAIEEIWAAVGDGAPIRIQP